MKNLMPIDALKPRHSDITEGSKMADSSDQSRRTSYKDDRIVGYLHAQKDSTMPNLRTYMPNKQELTLYNELRSKHGGTFADSNQHVSFVEASREKELLNRLQSIRADNNIKRQTIETLTSSLQRFVDGIQSKRHGLTSIKDDYTKYH